MSGGRFAVVDGAVLVRGFKKKEKMDSIPGVYKVDRMSMAVSLETRSPFPDDTLVEFAARLPRGLRLHGWSGKYLLKQAMQDALPAQILHRSKLGFNQSY